MFLVCCEEYGFFSPYLFLYFFIFLVNGYFFRFVDFKKCIAKRFYFVFSYIEQ